MARVYIGLGSNMAPESHLPAAVKLLREALDLTAGPTEGLTALSAVYRTPPWGLTEQADFLNAVAAAETSLAPLNLLDALQGIEARLNRERGLRWGPRTIDLDLLACGGTVLNHERLQLPHPRLHERAFALKPLCDLAPGWLHPLLGRSAIDLLTELDQSGIEPVALELGETDGAEGSGPNGRAINDGGTIRK